MLPVIAAEGLVEQVIPGSFAQWRSEDATPATANSGDRIVCVLGLAGGGAPGEPYLVTQTGNGLNTLLLSGELLQGTKYALGRGAAGVVAVNVSGGVPATYDVKADGGTKSFGVLTTTFFREPANGTRIAVVGSKATGFSVEIRNTATNTLISSNNVGLGLYVQYTGKGQATLEITENMGIKTLSTEVTGAPEDNVSISLTDLTVSELIRRLQESGPYTARYARDARLMAAGLDLTTAPVAINAFPVRATATADAAAGATSLTVAALTAPIVKGTVLRQRVGSTWRAVTVTADAAIGAVALTVSALGGAVTSGDYLFANSVQAATPLSAVKADFELFFNQKAAAAVTFVPGEGAVPDLQSGYFEGGATLDPKPSDWEQRAQAALKAYAIRTVLALQADPAVTAGLRAIFANRRSPRISQPLQFFSSLPEYVLPTNDTPAEVAAYKTEVKNEIAAVNDRDSVIIAQANIGNLTPSGLNGREKLHMVALRAAAARAAIGPGASLTNLTLGGNSPFPALDDDADEMARAGLLVLNAERRNSPTRVVLGRTAYVGEDNLAYESEKTVAIMNALTRDVRNIGKATVPGAGSVSRLADYERDLDDRFERAEREGWLTPGKDASGRNLPAYSITLERTSFQGRLASTKIAANPTPELLMTDADIVARMVEIEVSN